jgi:hypothetical protein
MGHLQKDMHSRQLAESIKELAALHAVDIGVLYPHGMAGAYVRAEGVDLFIIAGLGKQVVEGRLIFFLSPQAPLAKMLRGSCRFQWPVPFHSGSILSGVRHKKCLKNPLQFSNKRYLTFINHY